MEDVSAGPGGTFAARPGVEEHELLDQGLTEQQKMSDPTHQGDRYTRP
jgi:hypothetical protein